MYVSKKIALLGVLLVIGIADTTLLTIEHYHYVQSSQFILPCAVNGVIDCGKVLSSPYATILGIPLGLLGLLYYSFLSVFIFLVLYFKKAIFTFFVFSLTAFGVLFSVYLLYVQAVLIQKFCLYCLLSAFISVCVYILVRVIWRKEHIGIYIWRTKILYRYLIRPILFLFPSEFIHIMVVKIGEIMGSVPLIRSALRFYFVTPYPNLHRKISGILFPSPIGLSAGFDYEASLTQILPSLGFGFMTVGTITAHPYEGNTPPRLGRLVKSRSLLVNKGFKNPGVDFIIHKLEGKTFTIPVGISVGMTNKEYRSVQEAIADIEETFCKLETSQVHHSYYELNISCPNLHSGIDFTEPSKLKMLLSAIQKLKVKKPIWIKMPISISDSQAKEMLQIIINQGFNVVIFGNLQKNRNHPLLDQAEVNKFKKGYFSGKPTWARSNELISLARKEFGKRLTVIGCGGVFSPDDAKEKIARGATLVQLISGLIFEGPQLVTDINQTIAGF